MNTAEAIDWELWRGLCVMAVIFGWDLLEKTALSLASHQVQLIYLHSCVPCHLLPVLPFSVPWSCKLWPPGMCEVRQLWFGVGRG